MKKAYETALNLPELTKGPVGEIDLDWPLNAEVIGFIDEGPSIRIVYNVHTTKDGDVIFEDRLWDPDYKPAKEVPWHFLPANLKSAISNAKTRGKERMALWSSILKMGPKDAYAAMKSGDALADSTIHLAVIIKSGSEGRQYIKIVSSRVLYGELPRMPIKNFGVPELCEWYSGACWYSEVCEWYSEWCRISPNDPAPVLNDWLIGLNKRNQNAMKESLPTRPGERVASMI